ncbi:MAG: radical SAM protein [Armatimonadota bacterium]|nr:radical SAM protein [bacterium]
MAIDLYEKAKARLARESGGVAVERAAAVRFAFAFPNVYSVAMASLGYQLVYQMLNSLPNASSERVFLPDEIDLKEHLRTNTEIFSLETMSPLSEFDVIAFSISFEMDYLNVLKILRLGNLPVKSVDRDDIDPIVIVGGPCGTFNPEPLADFVDAFVVGDAEEVLPGLVDALESSQGKPREERLAALAALPSIYVPKFYQPEYDESGALVRIANISPAPDKVTRAVARDLSQHPSTSIIRTDEAEFGDIALVEVARGCGRKCRFCLAGHITRPLRLRDVDAECDASRLGLVGAAIFDHPEAADICQSIVNAGKEFTLSSVRLETVTPELTGLMAQGGQRTITIAPEAGSERLRRVINKNTAEEQMFSAVAAAREAGINRVKLYFMIGLPTETDDDIRAIIDLVSRLASEFQGINLQVSASSFVPKPWTPFQWHTMEREGVLKKRYATLRSGISSIKGANFGGESPRLATVQGYLARGDRRIGAVLYEALENDGDYSAALRKAEVDIKPILYKTRSVDDILPWDHIDNQVEKVYLWNEYQKALKGDTTSPCRIGECRICGACV